MTRANLLSSLRVALLYLLTCGAFIGIIIHLNDGAFTYALDDPYIHLAMAENLPQHLGINTEEVTNASSSILYTWLLVPFAQSEWAPLLINITAGLLVLLALQRLLSQMEIPASYKRDGLTLLAALALNLLSLIFIGMEHTLHVACALLLTSGLIDHTQGKRLPRWFWLAFALAPLLRYEALALNSLILLWFAYERNYKAVGLGLLLMVPPQLAQVAYMLHLGLPLLPSSVLQKSLTLADGVDHAGLGSFMHSLFEDVLTNIFTRAGVYLIVCLAGCTYLAWREQGRNRLLALTALVATLAHLILGKVGWFERYQAYIMGMSIFTCFYLLRSELKRDEIVRTVAGTFLMFILLVTLSRQFTIPLAAHNVYQQSIQLHRLLVEEIKAPVLAADIGTVSWQNPYMVVDVLGLGSEPIRQILRHEPNYISSMRKIADTYKLDLAILPSQFSAAEQVPPEWEHLALLHFVKRPVILPRDMIFYAINPTKKAEIEEKLTKWSQTLPEGVTFGFGSLAEKD